MQLGFQNGITSVVLRLKLRKLSDGSAYTGLDHTSSGLIIAAIADNEAATTAYTVAGSTVETITTLGTYAAPTATKCRFKAVDGTNHPGLYEIQIADARWAVSNARSVNVTVSGVSDIEQVDTVVQLGDQSLGFMAPTILTAIASYLDTEVAAIKAKTDNLPADPADASDILASFVKIRKYLQLLARKDSAIATDNATELSELNANGGSGAGGFVNTGESLEAIANITNLGTGARTVTVTVQTSGSVAIQNARVRMVLSGSTYNGLTNASGQVVFNLDDGTWTVSITATGYTYAGTTLVVDGTETPTYTMTNNSVSAPAAPNLSTGTLLCLGTDGLPEEDVEITFRMTAGPGDAGYALDAAEFTATSDVDGEIELDFVREAQYTARRGSVGREVAFTVPDAASFTLPEHLGAP